MWCERTRGSTRRGLVSSASGFVYESRPRQSREYDLFSNLLLHCGKTPAGNFLRPYFPPKHVGNMQHEGLTAQRFGDVNQHAALGKFKTEIYNYFIKYSFSPSRGPRLEKLCESSSPRWSRKEGYLSHPRNGFLVCPLLWKGRRMVDCLLLPGIFAPSASSVSRASSGTFLIATGREQRASARCAAHENAHTLKSDIKKVLNTRSDESVYP